MPFNQSAFPIQRLDALQGNSVNCGVVASASAGKVIAEDFGNFFQHHTLLTFLALPVITGNTSGASFGSKQIFTFPEGRISVDNVMAYFNRITFNTENGGGSDIAVGGSGDYSMGSTATADATLSSTDVDLLPSTAMLDPFVDGVGRSNVGSTLSAAALFDGTSSPLSMYLNTIIDDADVADLAANDPVFFTGWARVTWRWFGDY